MSRKGEISHIKRISKDEIMFWITFRFTNQPLNEWKEGVSLEIYAKRLSKNSWRADSTKWFSEIMFEGMCNIYPDIRKLKRDGCLEIKTTEAATRVVQLCKKHGFYVGDYLELSIIGEGENSLKEIITRHVWLLREIEDYLNMVLHRKSLEDSNINPDVTH